MAPINDIRGYKAELREYYKAKRLPYMVEPGYMGQLVGAGEICVAAFE